MKRSRVGACWPGLLSMGLLTTPAWAGGGEGHGAAEASAAGHAATEGHAGETKAGEAGHDGGAEAHGDGAAAHGEGAEATHGEGGAAHGEAHGGHHDFHRHHVGLFGGAISTEHATHPVVGLEYEFRVVRPLGLMLFAEAVAGEEVVTTGGFALVVHPWAGLKLGAALGLEIEHGAPVPLLRGTAGYDIHVGPLTLTPSVSLDYVHEHFGVLYGLAVGMGF